MNVKKRFKKGDRVRFGGFPPLGPANGATGTVSEVATGRGKSIHPDPSGLMTFVTWDHFPPEGVYTTQLHKIDALPKKTGEAKLAETLAEGIHAARAVVTNWERGDLAGAVNTLEGWADAAQKLLAPKRTRRAS